MSRLFGPAIAVGTLIIVGTVFLGLGLGPLYRIGVGALLFGLAGQFLSGQRQRPRGERESLQVAAPVSGSWRALNSPATKVPSHTHSLAQTYAIDVTHEPRAAASQNEAESRPDAASRTLDWIWPPMRRPQGFPSYGQPVLAPFAGVVVAAHGRSRDHLTRLSPFGLAYLLIEGFIRSLGAPRHLLGNHVLIRADSGETVVAVLAHLRRGSLQVSVGDRVVAGQPIAECGNSGNSSDPHVHFQIMDGEDIMSARGVPFTWEYSTEESVSRQSVPADGQLFTPK
ncbi:M23 family metallopeptidase [Brevibacterium casei]|uniref:M23 family metallopeptidase n=1 Tax=Brevibacterium casei TaxID=33889 RepID=UPI0028834D20|nr:M23 family metallopeptidase [Brevibacterium casei]